MSPSEKTKQQLLEELRTVRARNEELEALALKYEQDRSVFQKSDTLLRKVFETIPDLLAFIDKDYRIVHSNWHGGYDYVPEEVRRSKPICYKAYYGKDTPCEPCHVAEVIRTGKPVNREKFDSRIGHVEIRAYPIFDESNNVILVAENIRNITEQKKPGHADDAVERCADFVAHIGQKLAF